VLSIFLSIDRCAAPCAGAGGEVGTTAADTARRSHRCAPANRVIAAAAATTPRDPRLITRYYRPGQLNQSIGELSTTETTADATRAWTT